MRVRAGTLCDQNMETCGLACPARPLHDFLPPGAKAEP